MLSDIERKLLRIIANYTAIRKRAPFINELMIKTGRNRHSIYGALYKLNKGKYIEWSIDNPEAITLTESWEKKYQSPWTIQ